MWKRKPEDWKPDTKSYEDELKDRMEEQFREGKRTEAIEEGKSSDEIIAHRENKYLNIGKKFLES